MSNQDNPCRSSSREYYRMISFKAGKDLDERLIQVAAKQNLSISDVIRKCCLTALAANETVEN